MSAFEKRYLPSINQLFELRVQVVNSTEHDVEKQFYQLSQLRKSINLLCEGKRRLSDAMPFFFYSWDIFSSFPPEHDLYLPPLYKSDALNSILESGLKCLLEREAGIINGCDKNAGHLVLCGVEGAGKTTLMRALALAAAALLQKMVPISHDYLIFKKPEDIIWEAISVYHMVERDSKLEPLDVLNEKKHEAFLLLDEFQHNFLFPEDPNWIDGRDAAKTFHRYSRTSGTFGVIGGSSVDMHSLMFRRGRGESTDHWRKRGYPDFNGTLYALHTVPALRTVTKLRDYIQVRYPLWELKDQDLSLLLFYTGGIGRWVHNVWEACCFHPQVSAIGEMHCLCSEEVIRNCTNYRTAKHELVLESADNRELIAYLLITAQPGRDSLGNTINCGGVEKSLVTQALTMAGVSSPSDVIGAAEALSIIYIDTGSLVQFAHPIDESIFRNNMPPSAHVLLLLSAVHLMVCGICNADSGDVTDVNAGNALEELVRGHVYSSASINEDAEFYSCGVLSIKNQDLCLFRSADQSSLPLTKELLESLNLKHITWKKEHGLDGICFQKDDTRDNSWYLDLWQCKGGRRDVELGGGNNSMKTALSNFKKKHQLTDVGDKQITDIVLKAQVGLCLLVQALRHAMPAVIIRPRRLIVTTTKQCAESCVQTLKSWQNARGVQIEKYVLTHFGFNSRSKADSLLKSKFEVRVESGCDWVVNAIPEAIHRGIAKQLLASPPSTTSTISKDHANSKCIIQ